MNTPSGLPYQSERILILLRGSIKPLTLIEIAMGVPISYSLASVHTRMLIAGGQVQRMRDSKDLRFFAVGSPWTDPAFQPAAVSVGQAVK